MNLYFSKSKFIEDVKNNIDEVKLEENMKWVDKCDGHAIDGQDDIDFYILDSSLDTKFYNSEAKYYISIDWCDVK